MVKSARVTSTGALVAQGAAIYLLGIHYVATGTGGTVVLKSGGSGGTTVATVDTPAAAGGGQLGVPHGGLYFADGCHATLTNAGGCTIFYTEA